MRFQSNLKPSPQYTVDQKPAPVLPGNLLLDRLVRHAYTMPEQIAYTFLTEERGENTLTFAQLQQRVNALAEVLCHHVRPQECALLLYPSGPEFIIAFLACLRAGIIAVPSARPRKNRPLDRTRGILKDCQPTVILTTGDRIHAVEQSLAASQLAIPCLATDEVVAEVTLEAVLPEISPETIAFLQYTFGSTGRLERAVITHGELAATEQAIQQGFAFSAHSIMVSGLPLFQNGGLIGAALVPLYVGFPAILLAPPAFLQQPICWLQAISEYGETWEGSPRFSGAYCVGKVIEAEEEGWDIRDLPTVFRRAEPVRTFTLDQFYEAFAPYGFQRQAPLRLSAAPKASSEREDDFAEVGAARQVFQGLRGFGEGENTINNRLQVMVGHGGEHALEHGDRADIDTVDAEAAPDD